MRDLILLPVILLDLVLELLSAHSDECVVVTSVVLQLQLVHVDDAVTHAVHEVLEHNKIGITCNIRRS